MKKSEARIGGRYIAKISGAETTIRLTGESIYGGWDAINEKTGRKIRIRTAAKLRRAAETRDWTAAQILANSQRSSDGGRAARATRVAERTREAAAGRRLWSANVGGWLTITHKSASETRAAMDGIDFDTSSWHRGESAGDTYVEIIRTGGRDFHGYVDRATRKLVQAG